MSETGIKLRPDCALALALDAYTKATIQLCAEAVDVESDAIIPDLGKVHADLLDVILAMIARANMPIRRPSANEIMGVEE